METDEILTLLGLEERLEFLGKIRSLILAKKSTRKKLGSPFGRKPLARP